jgi:hypothetical protein
MSITVPQGKKKKRGDELLFNGPLDPESVGNTSHYQVTQKISAKKTARVGVVSATLNPTSNAITLVFNNPKAGKPLTVMVSGLSGANGAAVAPFSTGL